MSTLLKKEIQEAAENRNRKPSDSQVDAIKVPPHSLEAEQSVIGGLLLDNERWDTVAERVLFGFFVRLTLQMVIKHSYLFFLVISLNSYSNITQ